MLKDVGANWVHSVVRIGVAFVLMPFIIRMLGKDQYGTWILLASFTSYLSLLALGIPMATVRFVAKYAAEEDEEALNRTVTSCAALYTMIGLVAMVLGGILFVVFRVAYTIPEEFRTRADIAFGLVVIFVAAGFLGQLPYGIMSAHQDFVLRNKIQIGGLLLRLGLTYALLTIEATLVWLAVIQLVTLAFEFTVATIMVGRRYPKIRVRFRDFEWPMVRQILSFSLFVLLLHTGYLLAFQSDALVIGAFLPVSQVPLFTVASSLAIYLMEFVLAIAAVVTPIAASLEAQGRWEDLKTVFLKWSKITLSLSLLAILYLIVLGPRFIGWWIGPDFEGPSGSVLRILMVANLVYLPARGVSLAILVGIGRPGRPTVGFFITSVVNVGLSIVLVQPFALTGVAIGTALPNTVFAAYVLTITCRTLEVPLWEFAKYVVARPMLGALPVLAFLVWLRYGLDVQGFAQLFVAGIGTVSVFGLVWVFFVYRRDRYLEPSQFLSTLLRRSSP